MPGMPSGGRVERKQNEDARLSDGERRTEMATIHTYKPGDTDGVARPGEPYPRPYVTLKDGRTMTYKEWTDAGQPV